MLFINCKSEKKTQDFTAITYSYFDGKNELNPLDATLNGQSEYNDQLVFEMTDTYRNKRRAFFEKFATENGFGLESFGNMVEKREFLIQIK